ncbi:MAG: fasciclin domain-containing protein [Myxococcota bacterium]
MLLLAMGCGGGTSSGTGGGGGATTGGGGGAATGGGGGTTGGGSGGGGGGMMVGTIVDVAAANPDFSILVAAVQKAGLAATLADTSKQFTVFAPTNSAFTALLGQLGITNGLDGLSAEQLKPILLYHVLGAEVRAAAATTAATANQKVDALGGKVQLSLSGSSIKLDGRASVVMADVSASNGVIHVIDQVILPSITDIATTDARFSSLAAALALADTGTPAPNLVATLDDDAAAGFTVFAPTNDGFTALVNALKGADDGATTGITALTSFRADQVLPVLKYHVVAGRVLAKDVPATGRVDTLGGKVDVTRSGATVTVDGTNVVIADVLASNGVIHAIGSVILPSITDVVTTDGRFGALKGAVVAADADGATSPKVATALDGTQRFTLFAPTDASFAALPAVPSGQALTNVLLYHAAPGNPVYASAALSLTSPLSVSTALTNKSFSVAAEGSPKAVTIADGTATKAKVVATDVFCANGVIHVVDKVLLPAP